MDCRTRTSDVVSRRQRPNALDRPTITSWRFHVAARLVVGLSPLWVRWNGTHFHTRSGTLIGVPTTSNRRWKLICLRRKGTISALEALRDALYKSTTTTNTTIVPKRFCFLLLNSHYGKKIHCLHQLCMLVASTLEYQYRNVNRNKCITLNT